MYQTHPYLKEPAPDTLVWRYMDVVKFFSILENSSLFFPRLTTFQDPFEGHPPRHVVEYLRTAPGDGREEIARKNIEYFRNTRRLVCASCWHANETESDAMWNLYLRNGEGIAIRTTFQNLVNSFVKDGPLVQGGLVQYVDYDTFIPTRQLNIAEWATLKRLSFSHEREVRVLSVNAGVPNPGVAVPVDISTLISEVYVSPTTPDWMAQLFNRIMERYGLAQKVNRSDLYSPPTYYETEQ